MNHELNEQRLLAKRLSGLFARLLEAPSVHETEKHILVGLVFNHSIPQQLSDAELAQALRLSITKLQKHKRSLMQRLANLAVSSGDSRVVRFIEFLFGIRIKAQQHSSPNLGMSTSMTGGIIDAVETQRPRNFSRLMGVILDDVKGRDLYFEIERLFSKVRSKMVLDRLSGDDVTMMFGLDQPLQRFQGKTLSQVQHQYLDEMARNLYSKTPVNERPTDWSEFKFDYEDSFELGRQLQHLRKALDVTQVELSERSSIPRPNLSRIESGYQGAYTSKASVTTIYKYLSGLETKSDKKNRRPD